MLASRMLLNVSFTRILLAAVLVCFLGVETSLADAIDYQLSSTERVDFGSRIDTPYILDVADIDRDGADDFALSAKTRLIDKNNPEKNKSIRSFLVLNRPRKAFEVIDLGENGFTQRTWSGRFFKLPASQSTFFILGRNGELGLPHTLVGEHQSLFEIKVERGRTVVNKVFEEGERGTASSVDACDIDGDGTTEIYINNNGGPQSKGFLEVHIVSVGTGSFLETFVPSYTEGVDKHGSYNRVRLADVNGDAKCDFLAAIEVEKRDEYTVANANERINSYIILNRQGSFSGARLDLPNPPFGSNNAAFSIETAWVNGEQLVALTSSEFRGHSVGFRKFAFQLFAFRKGVFFEVTKDILSGKIEIDEAGQAEIRFSDIDSDGDIDIYLSRYSAAIQVFLNDGKRLVRRTLKVDAPPGQKAVAFLRVPGKACLDIALVDSQRRLYRFECLLN